MVATLHPRNGISSPAHHEHLLSVLARLFQCLISVLFQRDRLAAAQTLISGDGKLGTGVNDAAGKALRREPAKHDRMHGADARAREHGVSRFGNHGQVNGDAISLLDPERL